LTTDNKKKNVHEELVRAEECLKEADTLGREGLSSGAVSRLYYYVFHTVRALLFSKGLEPKTHEGSLRLLSLHFVKTGILGTEETHMFTRLMKYREEADYNPSYFFAKDDYSKFKKEAVSFHDRVLKLLKNEDLA